MAGGTITIYKGDNKTWRLTVLDSAGVAVDMTGSQVEFFVKKSPTATAIISKDSDVSGEIDAVTDGSDGLWDINLVPADTSSEDPGNYGYCVIETASGGEVYTLADDTFTLDDC